MSLQFQKVDKLIRQEEDNTKGIYNSHLANILESYNNPKLNPRDCSQGAFIWPVDIYNLFASIQEDNMARIVK